MINPKQVNQTSIFVKAGYRVAGAFDTFRWKNAILLVEKKNQSVFERIITLEKAAKLLVKATEEEKSNRHAGIGINEGFARKAMQAKDLAEVYESLVECYGQLNDRFGVADSVYRQALAHKTVFESLEKLAGIDTGVKIKIAAARKAMIEELRTATELYTNIAGNPERLDELGKASALTQKASSEVLLAKEFDTNGVGDNFSSSFYAKSALVGLAEAEKLLLSFASDGLVQPEKHLFFEVTSKKIKTSELKELYWKLVEVYELKGTAFRMLYDDTNAADADKQRKFYLDQTK